MSMTSRWEIFPDDLGATTDFYVRVLGFEIVKDERDTDAPYLSLQRGQARIGAAQRPPQCDASSRQPPVGVELVLEVNDVDEERMRILDAGWPLREDVAERPWGQTDLRVVDPSGYYLRITNRG